MIRDFMAVHKDLMDLLKTKDPDVRLVHKLCDEGHRALVKEFPSLFKNEKH